MPKLIHSQREAGFTFIELMITLGITSIIALAVLTLQNVMNKGMASSAIYYQAETARRTVTNILQNTNSWKKTVALNNAGGGSMACLYNGGAGGGDCTNKGGSFKLYDATGAVYYDATSSTSGFNTNGAVCNSYNSGAGTGTSLCPFHLDLSWVPVCPSSGLCTNPGVHVVGIMKYNPGASDKYRALPLNSSQYGINIQLNSPY